MSRVVKVILRLIVGAFALLFLWSMTLVLLRGNSDELISTEAMVVLGSAQFDGRPQPVFENRLQTAQDRYAKHPEIIFTVGGKLPGDRFTEAEAGKRWLIAGGIVKESDIIAVPRGRDTWESMQAVATVAKDQGISSIAVVSDAAHVARCQAMLKHLGVANVQVNPTRSGPGSDLTAKYVLRETLGLMRFWISDAWFS